MVLGDQTVTVEEHRLRELVSQGGGRADGRRDGQPHGDTHGRGRSSRGEERQEELGVSGEQPGVGDRAVRTLGSRPWPAGRLHGRLLPVAAPVSTRFFAGSLSAFIASQGFLLWSLW